MTVLQKVLIVWYTRVLNYIIQNTDQNSAHNNTESKFAAFFFDNLYLHIPFVTKTHSACFHRSAHICIREAYTSS